MSGVEIVKEVLADGRVQAVMALLAAAAVAAPLLRIRHDWREVKLREREVKAQERQARALEKLARGDVK